MIEDFRAESIGIFRKCERNEGRRAKAKVRRQIIFVPMLARSGRSGTASLAKSGNSIATKEP